MIKIIRYSSIGHRDHGWLKAGHHFSFADYMDADRMGFGVLRVVNDDWIAPGGGFDPHPHRDMEIITYVRSGALTHEDSMGNVGVIAAGDVQVMSAGSGVVHAEYNQGPQPVTLYQIWIYPAQRGVQPRWETRKFPKEALQDTLPVLASGFQQDIHNRALEIAQAARICGGTISAGTTFSHGLINQGYMLISKGSIECDGVLANAGDAIEITQQQLISITAKSDAEVLVIDVPTV